LRTERETDIHTYRVREIFIRRTNMSQQESHIDEHVETKGDVTDPAAHVVYVSTGKRRTQQPASETSKTKQRQIVKCYPAIFHVWMTLFNIISSVNILYFYAGGLTSFRAVYIECWIALVKWMVEVYFGNFTLRSTDLIAHHLAFFCAAGLTQYTQFQKYQPLIIHGVVIHIPLIFANAKKVVRQRSPMLKNTFDFLFVTFWAPAAMFRTSKIASLAYQDIFRDEYLSGSLLTFFFIVFLSLDYMWTPWEKYGRYFNIVGWCRKMMELGRIHCIRHERVMELRRLQLDELETYKRRARVQRKSSRRRSPKDFRRHALLKKSAETHALFGLIRGDD